MKYRLTIAALLLTISIFAKEPIGNIFWLQLNTKAGTPFSIDKPEEFLSVKAIERRNRHSIVIDSTDLPINPVFIDSLKTLGFYIKHTSNWMNGAIAILDYEIQINTIALPSFVSSYEMRKNKPLKSTSNKFEDEIDYKEMYGSSYDQIAMLGGHNLHDISKGEGVHVAVIDAGFINTDKISTFDSLFAHDRVLGTFDVVNPGGSVYDHHYHGNAVLSIMAGNKPGQLIGSAPEASYWLIRSEDVSSEYPIEEDYWIIAAEFADSVGCDVINTSLGYSTFDDEQFNHSYSDYTGSTFRVSKAANLAVNKGIVVVCSAGNSGNDSWGHIIAPSEAKNVLSVAAVDANGILASFSSRGFEGDGYLPKPDISAMGKSTTYATTDDEITVGNGTSFSSPVIAGMAACLVGIYPEKTATEIIEIIRSSGHLFPEHNTDYGYGIPNFSELAGAVTVPTKSNNELKIFPNPFNDTFSLKSVDKYESIKVIDSKGQLVYSKVLHDKFIKFNTPEISNLKKGLYIVILEGNKKIQTHKVIKQ